MADLIRYDLLAQEALRGVVRKVLSDVARDGLPGDHHLYIAFDTRSPGVRLSTRMRERYPEEMTIVLQHQFWDLNVTEHAFEVGLSFGGVPERLLVPFAAMKGFFDPSVQFGLQFESEGEGEEAKTPAKPADAKVEAPAKAPQLAPARQQPAEAAPVEAAPRRKPRAEPAAKDTAPEPAKDAPKPPAAPEAGAETAPRSAEIVSIDKFRKK